METKPSTSSLSRASQRLKLPRTNPESHSQIVALPLPPPCSQPIYGIPAKLSLLGLPTEILLDIFERLPPKTLQSISLVSRACAARFQCLVLRKIDVFGQDRAEEWEKCKEKEKVMEWAREVSCSFATGPVWRPVSSDSFFFGYLPQFTRLVSLNLISGKLSSHQDYHLRFFSPHKTNLRVLKLSHFEFEAVDNLIEFVSYFTQLEELHLIHLNILRRGEEHQYLQHQSLHKLCVRHLSIPHNDCLGPLLRDVSWKDIEIIIDADESTPRTLNPTALIRGVQEDVEVLDLQYLFRMCHYRSTVLPWKCSKSYHPSLVGSNHTTPDLSKFLNLRELKTWGQSPYKNEIEMVSTIESTNIRKISLTKFPPHNDYEEYWERLDLTLRRLIRRIPELTNKVEVRINPIESCGELDKNLPEFEKVGRVTFVDRAGEVVYSAGSSERLGEKCTHQSHVQYK